MKAVDEAVAGMFEAPFFGVMPDEIDIQKFKMLDFLASKLVSKKPDLTLNNFPMYSNNILIQATVRHGNFRRSNLFTNSRTTTTLVQCVVVDSALDIGGANDSMLRSIRLKTGAALWFHDCKVYNSVFHDVRFGGNDTEFSGCEFCGESSDVFISRSEFRGCLFVDVRRPRYSVPNCFDCVWRGTDPPKGFEPGNRNGNLWEKT